MLEEQEDRLRPGRLTPEQRADIAGIACALLHVLGELAWQLDADWLELRGPLLLVAERDVQ